MFNCNYFRLMTVMGEANFMAELDLLKEGIVARARRAWAAGAALPAPAHADRVRGALQRLRLADAVDFSSRPGVRGDEGWRYDTAYTELYCGTAYPVAQLTTLLTLELRRQGRLRGIKRRAKDSGLAYWPALMGARVDPAAFRAAEEVLCGITGGRYGDPLPATHPDAAPARHRGGWDGAGHYGVTPHQVEEAWFLAGCRDSRKFRLIVASLHHLRPEVSRGRVVLPSIAKRDSAARTANVLRGMRWAQANVAGGAWRFAKRALIAIGRIAPWARWAAVSGGVLEARATLGVIGLMDLNWAEVDRLQKGPRWQRVQHAPARLQWQFLHGVDRPDGIAKEMAVIGAPLATYQALCALAGVEPFAGPDHKAGLRQPAMNLARLFGRLGEVQRYAALKGVGLDTLGIHDLGQFALPFGRFDAQGWRRLVFKYPTETLARSAQWAEIERELGRAPATLVELRTVAAKLLYSGIETVTDLEVATVAAKAGLDQFRFEAYRSLMRGTLKEWEAVPAILVYGPDLGLEGEWRLRQLPAWDPLGPMLGVVTNCCQHLHGAAASCARAGVQSPYTAFWVVEYRGQVVAQAWVWRSKGDQLVLDSVEGLDTAYVEGVAKLLRAAALQAIGRLGITGVRLGHTSYGLTKAVSKVLGCTPCADEAEMAAPTGYADGARQRAIPGVPA